MSSASAAVPGAPALDGAALGLAWCLPFAGLLLSIAVLPVAAPKFWHGHYGKVAAAWAGVLLVPLALAFGVDVASYEILHTALLEYIPFVALLLALYTASSGIRISGPFDGRPASNTALLALGTAVAGWIGTTGASIVLIQTLIRANRDRKRNTHVFVFFIFLVGNIGGALTPLGDPPLFLGYLEGVDFFWFAGHMALPMLAMALPLLAVFYLIDRHLWRSEGKPVALTSEPFTVAGKRNIAFMAAIVAVVLGAGAVAPPVSFTVYHVAMPAEGAIRTAALLAIAVASVLVTPNEMRVRNAFSWGPMLEVAKLFAAIFITMVPALTIIGAGDRGVAGPLLAALNRQGAPDTGTYFWLTGLFSSVLDNAPTYLIFFRLAGGDAVQLMGPLSQTLTAISAAAVFMGANTYVGNAPNFLVRAICDERGVRMPTFFGYMAWSAVCLGPLYVAVSYLFF